MAFGKAHTKMLLTFWIFAIMPLAFEKKRRETRIRLRIKKGAFREC